MRVAVFVITIDVFIHGSQLQKTQRAGDTGVWKRDACLHLQFGRVGIADKEVESVLAAQAESKCELPVDVELNAAFRLQAESRYSEIQTDIAADVREVFADFELPRDVRII